MKANIINLTAQQEGARLDKYVGDNSIDLSRSLVKELIKRELVKVNGKAVKPSLKLAIGDTITITVPPEETTTLQAEAIPISIIYEDEDLMVVDKPPFLTVHPAPGHKNHTLVNALLSHFPQLPDSGDRLRPGIVHRLDKDTSGLMLVAKNRVALANLQRQFKNRTVKKIYLVLVKGHISPLVGIIDAPIGRDHYQRQRMSISNSGRNALTDYRVLRYVGGNSLLEVNIKTGRTHQIRVHLGAIGFPVLGDATYGVKVPQLKRQFVHAHQLTFKLPSSGQTHCFTSELPADLTQVLSLLA
jgi:23S rRNA pseudouridine1911/1915/1917 synthase